MEYQLNLLISFGLVKVKLDNSANHPDITFHPSSLQLIELNMK